ncbi:hypothetical protein AB0K05_37215 [Nonomuraea sp. NPDC049486]|uniref:hypothetical protein n=1 Tax=Nonomuraea sp. NPDC049486 TaxID=3155773 RepID=UPI003435B12C
MITACVREDGTVRIPPGALPQSTAPQSIATVSPTPFPTSGGVCGVREREITWNQSGPVGPAGPRGDIGAQGPQGDRGAPGLSEVETVMGSTVSIAPGGSDNSTAQCPPGKIVIGGRYQLLEETRELYSDAEVRIPDMGTGPFNTYWHVRVSNVSDEVVRIRPWATCAKVGQ